MKKPKHSPGPWFVEPMANDEHGDIQHLIVRNTSPSCVAIVLQASTKGEAVANKNARLMAAAPELLDSLEGLISAIGKLKYFDQQKEHRGEVTQCLMAADKAIKKVKGE